MSVRLLTPGPVMVKDSVLRAVSSQVISHRSEEYRSLHRETIERLRHVLGLEDWIMLLIPGSGTTAVDAVSWSVAPGKRVLALVWGEFGSRLADTLRRAGAKVDVLEAPPGSVIRPDIVAEHAVGYDIVALVHNETGTGTRYPWLGELADMLDEGQGIIVDSVSAAGAEETKPHERIIAYATCSHKALAAPPGTGIVAFNPVWAKLLEERSIDPPPSIDLAKYVKFAEKDETPFTPPVNIVAGLATALREIEEIGPEEYREIHKKRANILYNAEGLSFLPEEYDARSRTVVAVKTPGKATLVKKELAKHGIIVATGMKNMKNDVIRIGVMGAIEDEWIREAVDIIKTVLD